MTAYVKTGGHGKRLHQYVMEQFLGRSLEGAECIHHKDLDPANNDISNLMLCKDQKEHMFFHTQAEALKACGEADYRKCYICQQWGPVSLLTQVQRSANSSRPNSGNYFYHSACATANYHLKKERINNLRNVRRYPDKVRLNADALLEELK